METYINSEGILIHKGKPAKGAKAKSKEAEKRLEIAAMLERVKDGFRIEYEYIELP